MNTEEVVKRHSREQIVGVALGGFIRGLLLYIHRVSRFVTAMGVFFVQKRRSICQEFAFLFVSFSINKVNSINNRKSPEGKREATFRGIYVSV